MCDSTSENSLCFQPLLENKPTVTKLKESDVQKKVITETIEFAGEEVQVEKKALDS